MTAHNFDHHALDSLLQNTLQLHRKLNKTHSGITQTAVIPHPHRPPVVGLGLTKPLPTRDSSTGFGRASGTGSGSGSEAMMAGEFSSSSSKGPASPRSATVIASATPVPGAFSSSSTPSSPTRSSFASPQVPRLPSASTFASYHDRPQRLVQDAVGSADQFSKPLSSDRLVPSLSVDTTALPIPAKSANGAPYTRSYAKSLTGGTYQQQLHSPQPQSRRPKISLNALANMDHNGRSLNHILVAHDLKDDNSTISINVRFVSKDLWIRVEIPRGLPVHMARDLVLEKCQLQMAPPSAPSSLADTAHGDDETLANHVSGAIGEHSKDKVSGQVDSKRDAALSLNTLAVASKDVEQDPSKMPTLQPHRGTHKSIPHGNSQSEKSIARSTRSNTSSGEPDKDGRHSHASLDEKDVQLKAAVALMARLDLFAESINGCGEEASKLNYAKAMISQSNSNSNSNVHDVPSSVPHPGPSKVQQLKRLMSHSSIHNDEIQATSPSDRANRESGSSRLGHIPSWGQWRDRHNSHSGRHIGRDIQDHGEMLLECPKQGQTQQNEAFKKECDAWRASFGLFWVAAGHWLDDSRIISSYHLQPQDLLELQLRNHYIHLPPPGGSLIYQDHYAEGILYKLSKKNRPVSMLTHHNGKEPMGVWKERWVVLQGTKLLIYHKRKDTTKKTIELSIPLHVMPTVLPPDSRHFFKVTASASATMSSVMVALTASTDPQVPKLCFRGTSDNDMNHWIRIFNSLNSNTMPLTSSRFVQVGSGSPNLGSLNRLPDSAPSIASALSGYSSDRKRNHTTTNTFNSNAATVPSIDPVLISNAAVAISNLTSQNNNNGTNGSNQANSSINFNIQHPPATLGSQYRGGGQQSISLGGSAWDSRDPNTVQHHPLTSASSKDDIRRRAITEPNRLRLLNPQQQHRSGLKSPLKDVPEGQLPRTLDVSNVSETPFKLDSPPNTRARRPVLGTEYLDNASQVLLATSSARSSMAPLYSGYIWIYIPHVPTLGKPAAVTPTATKIFIEDEMSATNVNKLEKQRADDSLGPMFDGASDTIPFSYSPPSSLGSESDACSDGGNALSPSSPSSSAGRYVKCFAVISDQGHFQWVEVKKQTDLEGEMESKGKLTHGASSSSLLSTRSSYGIHLKSARVSEDEQVRGYGASSPLQNSVSAAQLGDVNASEENSLEVPPSTPMAHSRPRTHGGELIQASMTQKLRLFFFCIKISPSALADVLLLSTMETTGASTHVLAASLSSTPSAVPGSSSGVSVSVTGSTSANAAAKAANKIRHRLSSSLSTLTSSALPPLPSIKSSSLSGSISKGKNMTWPSISSPQDRELSQSSSSHHGHSQHQQQQQQQQSLHPDRALSASSGSVKSMSHKGSSVSLKSTLSHTAAVPAGTMGSSPIPSSPDRDEDRDSEQHNARFSSPTSAESGSPPSSSSSSSSSSTNVLSLAQNLQKAVLMNRGQSMSSESRASGNGAGASSSVGSCGTSVSRTGSAEHRSALQSQQSSPSGSAKARRTLSEALVANQSALPDSAATMEQSKLLQDLEIQQRVLRAEEKSRAKYHQYNQQQQQQQERYHQHHHQHHQHHQPHHDHQHLHQHQHQTQYQNQNQHQQHQQHGHRQQLQHRQHDSNQQQEQIQTQETPRIHLDSSSSISINSICPFLELGEDVDENGETVVTLKGYTETEEGWRALHHALERFLDGSINDHSSALPPEETLIPSYHSPPEVLLSEKAQRFLSAKESLIEEANLAASKAAVEAARAPTPDVFSTTASNNAPVAATAVTGGTSGVMTATATPSTTSFANGTSVSGGGGSGSGGGGGNGPVAQIRAVSLTQMTRWMHLSGADRSERNKGNISSTASVTQAMNAEAGLGHDMHLNTDGTGSAGSVVSGLHSPKRGASSANVFSLSLPIQVAVSSAHDRV